MSLVYLSFPFPLDCLEDLIQCLHFFHCTLRTGVLANKDKVLHHCKIIQPVRFNMNVSERIIVLFYFLVLEMLCGMFMTYRLWENGSIWWTALWWILCSRWTLGAGIALAPVSCLFCEHRRLDKFIFITSSACKVQVCSQTITYTHIIKVSLPVNVHILLFICFLPHSFTL